MKNILIEHARLDIDYLCHTNIKDKIAFTSHVKIEERIEDMVDITILDHIQDRIWMELWYRIPFFPAPHGGN